MDNKMLNKNISIILNKIKEKNDILVEHSNINEKIMNLIKCNGSIDYDKHDYECSYKTEIYGPFGVSIELDKIHILQKN